MSEAEDFRQEQKLQEARIRKEMELRKKLEKEHGKAGKALTPKQRLWGAWKN